MVTLYYLMKMSKNKRKMEIDDYYSNLHEDRLLKTTHDLTTKCRVCLQQGTTPIYENEKTQDILKALRLFGDIQVSEDDDYPKYLCSTCNKFVREALMFRKIAKETDEALKQPVKEETSVFDQTQDNYSDSSTYETKQSPQKWISDDTNFSNIKMEKKETIKYTAKVTCHICNKVINRSYYKEHLTMHDPDHKKYVCDVCGKSFRLRCAYHNHSLRHRSDFPYKCQFCPYRGRYSELLKTHMRTHTGDYRYMCTECPARFLFKSNLNSHMLKHKEPQFKCDTCKRAFHTKLTLQRHFEADHLGIKNHVCNICGKAFGYRNAMMKHQRHVHKREKLLFGRMPSYLEAEHRNQDGCL